jgi:Protein of unknown function (DUF3039)
MSNTETRPIDADADTDEDDGYAHYARKDEIARAAVLGGTVTALCGLQVSVLSRSSHGRPRSGSTFLAPCVRFRTERIEE